MKRNIFDEFSHIIIWNNRSIFIENKSIYFKDWAEKGVIFVQDFLNKNGDWMTFQEFIDKYYIRTNFLYIYGSNKRHQKYLNVIHIELSV